jgi:hypothetical protein
MNDLTPPEPVLNLKLADGYGLCDGCGFPYLTGEVIDVQGDDVYCQACIETEQPGAVADFLDPDAANVYDDGADELEIPADAFDDAAFVDGDADGFSALLQPKPGKASEFYD